MAGSSRIREAPGATVSIDPSSASFLADYGPARFLAATAGAVVILLNVEEGGSSPEPANRGT